MTQTDATVVNVALPAIREVFGAPFDEVQWVVGGYLLALALALPINAWLVGRVGARRVYLVCFSAFTLASLFCGMARSIELLIVARLFQGVSGGLLAPMGQLMLARAAGPHMARVMGYSAIPILIAPVIGPVVAGSILHHAGWPWLFYINLPIGIVAVALAYFLLPREEAPASTHPLDLPGLLLISPALVCLLYGLDHVPGLIGTALLVAGLLLSAAFVVHARRRGDAALLDLRLFENRRFTTAAVTQFLSNGSLFGGQMLLPLFLITGCGFPPTTAGWMLAPIGVGMLCVYPLMGLLTDRFGCRAVSATGALVVALSTLPMLWMTQNAFVPSLMGVALFARGLGQSGIGLPSITAAYASVPREKIPLATTASNIVQRLGGPTATTAIGIAVALTVTPNTGRSTFLIPFVVLAALQVLLFASATRLPVRITR